PSTATIRDQRREPDEPRVLRRNREIPQFTNSIPTVCQNVMTLGIAFSSSSSLTLLVQLKNAIKKIGTSRQSRQSRKSGHARQSKKIGTGPIIRRASAACPASATAGSPAAIQSSCRRKSGQ